MTPLGPASSGRSADDTINDLNEFFNRLIQPLYAVLDTSRDCGILPLLEKSGCEYRLLYGNRLASIMDGLGPHLIALPQKTPMLTQLLEKGWGNSWGIFLTSPADLPAVHRHLQRLLAAKLPNGKHALFRFYDPRVLRDYLPRPDAAENVKFFGPISSIFVESTTGQKLHFLMEMAHFTSETHSGHKSHTALPQANQERSILLCMSPEQLEIFSRRNEERFIGQLTASAATAYPEIIWMKGREGLRQLVLTCVEEGKTFGLSYEYTLGRYTYWRLDHGDAILTQPEWEFLRAVMQDDTMAEEEKIIEIDTLLYGATLYPEHWDHE
jgi:hypothetical protein